MLLMITAALLLGLNIRKQCSITSDILPYLPLDFVEQYQSMGWPWPYHSTTLSLKLRMLPDGNSRSDVSTATDLNTTAVAKDVFVCIAILLVLAGVCESLVRLRRPRKAP